MSASPWKYPPDNIPSDGQTVWLRLASYYVEPFKATYTSSTQQFQSVTNTIIYPMWSVAAWRPV